MKTQIAVLYRTGEALAIEEVEVPLLKLGQVLVKVYYSGVCGSQLSEINGSWGPDCYLPHCLGHEGSGVVVDIGDGVKKVKAGDHVIISWMTGQGLTSTPPVYRLNGKVVNAGFSNTFAQHSIISENRLFPISKNIPLDEISILGCAVATGFGAVVNDAQVVPGSSVLIIGAGGVGFNAIQSCRLMNPSKLIVVSRNENKLTMAEEFGATHLLNPHKEEKDIPVAIKDFTNGQGVDCAIDTVGSSSTITLALNCVKNNNAKVVIVGIPHHQDTITLNACELGGGKSIIKSIGGSIQPEIDFPRIINLYEDQKLNLKKIITKKIKFSAINDAFAMLKESKVIGRSILEMHSTL